MENQFKIMEKIPNLLHHLSGSCHSTNPSNVIESSIAINNTTSEATFAHHHHHHLPSKKTKKIEKPILISDSEFRRTFIRPVTSIESFSKRNSSNSSNNGGWFSSEENEDEDGDDHDDIFDYEEGSFYCSSSVSSSQSFSRKIIRNGVKGHRRTTKTSRESCSSRRKTKNVPRRRVGWNFCEVSSTSSNDFDYYDCGSFRRKTVNSCRRTRKAKGKRSEKMGCSKIEESYAVEKDSNDPYRDFKISMVEMIAENEILGEEELEKLLLCFLSLNSCCHHEIILDVFSEVCTTLFDDLVN